MFMAFVALTLTMWSKVYGSTQESGWTCKQMKHCIKFRKEKQSLSITKFFCKTVKPSMVWKTKFKLEM